MNPNSMTPVDWAKRPLQRYADFEDRAPRAEYWWFYLAYVIAYIVAAIVDSILGTWLLRVIVVLGAIIPMVAVGARRLHDTDRSGWWMLIAFIPIIGAIVLLVWYVTPGDAGQNRFGANPYDGDTAPDAVPAE
jgi:uncharacterized membrane protein YhaH (DUF805 family)